MQLTSDQQTALKELNKFILHPTRPIHILSGYSGCGKSTLVKFFLAGLPEVIRTQKLLVPSTIEMPLILAASTNKAARVLSDILDTDVGTIHSSLGIKIKFDYKTGKVTTLVNPVPVENSLILIDECSYIDDVFLTTIYRSTTNCKFLFIGDSAQLNIKGKPVVFNKNYPESKLTKVVRQSEGNPIIDVATNFRNVVNGATWKPFKLIDPYITKLTKPDFNRLIKQEFNNCNWDASKSKLVAWRNNTVIEYNKFIQSSENTHTFPKHTYAICNSYIQNLFSLNSISTEELVYIQESTRGTDLDVEGTWVTIKDACYFVPDNFKVKEALLKLFRKEQEWEKVKKITSTWIDLRHPYASTVDKAQGSTYDKIFIDLDDLSRCTNPNRLARMLYVAVSRARHQVIFTGDFG